MIVLYVVLPYKVRQHKIAPPNGIGPSITRVDWMLISPRQKYQKGSSPCDLRRGSLKSCNIPVLVIISRVHPNRQGSTYGSQHADADLRSTLRGSRLRPEYRTAYDSAITRRQEGRPVLNLREQHKNIPRINQGICIRR